MLELNYTDEFIEVSGKTYPHKDFLKSLGAKFSPETKHWILAKTEENHMALARLTEGSSLLPAPKIPPPLPDHLVFEQKPVKEPPRKKEEERKEEEKKEEPQTTTQDMGVFALMQRVEQVLLGSFKAPLWVTGELQNINFRKNALFFQLSEGNGQTPQSVTVSCNLWAGQLSLLKKKHGEKEFQELFQEGFQVRLLCMVQFYKGRGQVSLNVVDWDLSYTKGLQALQREALIKELKASGLFDANKKLPFPRLPFRVGLITAQDSRAFGDFTHQLVSLGFPGEIFFYPSAMQGPSTLVEVVQGLSVLKDLCDVIVLTRGGGSQGDLAWFDGKEIAYSIGQCPIPVISAIGHHDDQTIAQDISYLHCKTPTAAADFIGEHFIRTKDSLREYSDRLTQGLLQKILREEERLSKINQHWQRWVHMSLDRWTRTLDQKSQWLKEKSLQSLSKKESLLEQKRHELFLLAMTQLETCSQNLFSMEKKLISRDPRPWLEKGWTQLMDLHGQSITSVTQTYEEQKLTARLKDGKVHLRITS